MTDTRQALEEAFRTVFPPPPNAHLGIDVPALEAHTQIVRRFRRFLGAEAWTDAAMMLVPEGWLWRLMPSDTQGHWLSEVWADGTGDCEFGARADHPSLAIAQAALRAQEAGGV